MMLERLDVRVKTVLFIVVMVLVFLISDPLVNAGLLALILLGLVVTKTPLRGLLTMLQPLLIVFVLIALVTLFTGSYSADPEQSRVLFSVFGLNATFGGLVTGINFVLRILIMVAITYAFTVSTPIDDILALMSFVKAPYWLALLVSTAISFIPTMARKKDLIVEAQRARGAKINDGGPIGQVVSFVPIMVPLITGSILMADDLSVAMASRGYGANNSMTSMTDLTIRTSDWLVLIGGIAVLAAAIWLRFTYGFGVI